MIRKVDCESYWYDLNVIFRMIQDDDSIVAKTAVWSWSILLDVHVLSELCRIVQPSFNTRLTTTARTRLTYGILCDTSEFLK